jgi:hypothetical protein
MRILRITESNSDCASLTVDMLDTRCCQHWPVRVCDLDVCVFAVCCLQAHAFVRARSRGDLKSFTYAVASAISDADDQDAVVQVRVLLHVPNN